MVILADLQQRLPICDPEAVRKARQEAASRPIVYPFGSGQAEEVALASRLRPLIRQLLEAPALERAIERFERAGFLTGIAPLVYGPTQDGWDWATEAPKAGQHGARQALFVGRDRGRIEQAIACDNAKTDDADIELGRLLGYPRCCVEAFVEVSVQRRNTELYEAAGRRTQGKPIFRLNALDLGIFHYISWSPCSYDCGLSAAYADAVATRLTQRSPASTTFIARIDEALHAHRLVLCDEVQLSFYGEYQNNVYHPTKVWPTAADRHPNAALADLALDAVARALALVRTSKTITLTSEGLSLDGTLVAGTKGALAIPFGAS